MNLYGILTYTGLQDQLDNIKQAHDMREYFKSKNNPAGISSWNKAIQQSKDNLKQYKSLFALYAISDNDPIKAYALDIIDLINKTIEANE